MLWNARDSLFHMWYTAGGYGEWEIGYATSRDGISWSRDGRNPVVRRGERGRWDFLTASFPWVNQAHPDSAFRMWYTGSGTPLEFNIGYACSHGLLDCRLPDTADH